MTDSNEIQLTAKLLFELGCRKKNGGLSEIKEVGVNTDDR